jgi:hypothetical protein
VDNVRSAVHEMGLLKEKLNKLKERFANNDDDDNQRQQMVDTHIPQKRRSIEAENVHFHPQFQLYDRRQSTDDAMMQNNNKAKQERVFVVGKVGMMDISTCILFLFQSTGTHSTRAAHQQLLASLKAQCSAMHKVDS